MAMVCYCGERAFGSAEGGLSIYTVFNFNPRLFWAPLTCNYLALTVVNRPLNHWKYTKSYRLIGYLLLRQQIFT